MSRIFFFFFFCNRAYIWRNYFQYKSISYWNWLIKNYMLKISNNYILPFFVTFFQDLNCAPKNKKKLALAEHWEHKWKWMLQCRNVAMATVCEGAIRAITMCARCKILKKRHNSIIIYVGLCIFLLLQVSTLYTNDEVDFIFWIKIHLTCCMYAGTYICTLISRDT